MNHLKYFESNIVKKGEIDMFLLDLKSLGCQVDYKKYWINKGSYKSSLEENIKFPSGPFFSDASEFPRNGHHLSYLIKIFLIVNDLDKNLELASDIAELKDRLSDIGKVHFGITTNTGNYEDMDDSEYPGLEYSFAVITDEISKEMDKISEVFNLVRPYLTKLSDRRGDNAPPVSFSNEISVLLPHPISPSKSSTSYWSLMSVEFKIYVKDLNKIIYPTLSKWGWTLKNDFWYDGKDIKLQYESGTYLKMIFNI